MEAATQWAAIKHYGKQVCKILKKVATQWAAIPRKIKSQSIFFLLRGVMCKASSQTQRANLNSFDLFNLGLIKHRVIFNRVFLFAVLRSLSSLSSCCLICLNFCRASASNLLRFGCIRWISTLIAIQLVNQGTQQLSLGKNWTTKQCEKTMNHASDSADLSP